MAHATLCFAPVVCFFSQCLISDVARSIDTRFRHADTNVQCESKNPPPLEIFLLFPKWLGIFSSNFAHLLYVPIYTRLQNFYSITCNFDEVMPY